MNTTGRSLDKRGRGRAAAAIAATAAISLCLEAPLLACPVCFQIEDGAVVDGVRLAVIVLLGAVASVLVVAGAWWRRFMRAERALSEGS